MNWLDIVIIVCAIIGILHGLLTGIVKQIISLVSLVAAVLLSGAVAGWIRRWLDPHLQGENTWFSYGVQNAIFYILAFIFIIVLFALIAKLVDKIINFTPAGIINHLFGALFGAFMWVFCLSIVFNILVVFDTQSRIIAKPVKENSIFYEKVQMIFPTVFPHLQEILR